MHTFFLDLWHDLREKRLWPVAGLLLVAIAVVPFVLREESRPVPPATPPAEARTASDRLPTIALEDAASTGPSKLREFSQRNPFKPLNDLPEPADKPDADENKTVDLGESPDGSSARGGSGDASASGSGGAKPGASGSGPAPKGGSGGPGSGAGAYVGPRTTYYSYRADIRFGPTGSARTMKQVKAFTLLGSKSAPAAMFMGVTDDHKWAVFTVDTSRYESKGEHECKPTPQRCDFVYLEVADGGNETTFTTLDGETSYDLELTAIKRVVLDKADVENVPTEEDKSDGKDSAAPGAKDNTVDPEPRSLFDIFAKRG